MPLAAELGGLGGRSTRPAPGGVLFEGDITTCYRANLESRLASRVLMRLARSPYRTEQDVYDAAVALPWPDWFSERQTLRVDVSARRCPLKSLDFVTLRIKDAVCDRFRAAGRSRPDVDTRAPDIRVHAFLDASEVSLYLDTSGDPLHKRGYRADAGEAPLRENLAAGILRLTGWDGSEPLLDPMCGSGTLVAEAALIALAIPPGHARRFGFEVLRGFEAGLWKEVRAAALARRRLRKIPVFGRDRYGDEIEKARRNLETAGVGAYVELKQADVLHSGAPSTGGILVTNPPYGVRLGEQDSLAAFYPQLGDALKRNYAGWRCYLFSGDPQLPRLIRLSASRRIPLYNGAIECRLYEYKMVAGSARKAPSPP